MSAAGMVDQSAPARFCHMPTGAARIGVLYEDE